MFKPATVLVAAVLFLATMAPAAAFDDEDEADFDFYKYSVHSATLSAVASAAALVGPCPVPLSYSEFVEESYGTVELTVACLLDDGSEAAVILKFDILDNGYLLPISFEYAG